MARGRKHDQRKEEKDLGGGGGKWLVNVIVKRVSPLNRISHRDRGPQHGAEHGNACPLPHKI
jgi:hypothetical protein